MKKKSILQLIILAIFVSSSTQQAQNPNCQPIKATKNYDKTLFVFVVESSGSLDNGIKYLMKQFACSIPETENVKVYIMDYTNDSSLPTVKEEDLSTSKQFAGKIDSSLTGPTNANRRCRRMETCEDNLLKQLAVKNYAVKYIMINDNCHQSQPDHWSNIDLIYFSDTFWYKQDSGRAVFFKHGDVNAPQLLKDVTNKIIGTFLSHDSLWQTPAPSSSSNNSESETGPKDIIYGIIIGFLVLAFGASICFIVWKNCKCKKNKNKKEESRSSLLASESGKPILSEPIKKPQKAGESKNKTNGQQRDDKVEKAKKKEKVELKDETRKSLKHTQEPTDKDNKSSPMVVIAPKTEEVKTDLASYDDEGLDKTTKK